ncbi:uncharacterized protein V6R79_003628 [Siganus canaliculatus]
MASPKTIREWCRATCASYPSVQIRNMSTSFRDGLAFCAIIHKHRPDLIDFSSLCKNNGYQNNKLAFEIAETKLGIPAILDPNDMVCTKVPDCLSVLTYLSQYYYFFNRKSYAGLTCSGSSHVTVLNNITKSKSSDGLKLFKSSTDLETRQEDHLSHTRPRTVCTLCFKPVHLIQRHLIDGKIYHRCCFRCKVCHSTLLPGSYTQASDAASLICTHHTTDSDISQEVASTDGRPKCAFQTGFFSLAGLPITSVPYYTKKTESQDRLVCRASNMEAEDQQQRNGEGNDRENRDNRDLTAGLERMMPKLVLPCDPIPCVEDSIPEEAGKDRLSPILADGNIQQATTSQEAEVSSACAQVIGGSDRPVPTPRRKSGSSVNPVPVPRTKTSQNPDTSSSSENKGVASSSQPSSPTGSALKVKSNHPWLAIIHPGPWTQLPPAPAPVPSPRTKSVAAPQTSLYRPKVPAPNPFAEDVDEETQEEADEPESTTQPGNTGGPLADVSEAAAAAAAAEGPHVPSAEAEGYILPRSLSVPAITPGPGQSSPLPAGMAENDECNQVPPCQTKSACKENPFDRKPMMSKSKTFQSLSTRRAPAPGHGFPLIKRKVQTDQSISIENLQLEMSDVDKHLGEMEQRGLELEKKLRDCKNDTEQEQMLMEWFALVQEKNVLVQRDAELVYLTKQQKLEERQADVEYKLRCLLNKPESDWSQEDRREEQQLMDELVQIIEQRNQIISYLDQDRQRCKD